jgi:protein-S-isoprenylcysteine O-methyltransferase Ste14
MKWLELKIPPVIVLAACALLMWVVDNCTTSIYIDREARVILWAVFMMLAITFCLSGVLCFLRNKTTANPIRPENSSVLVTDGVYKVSRNPMYFGMLCLLFAWWLFLSNLWSLVGCLLFVLYMNRFQIHPEEKALEKLFGSPFVEYCKDVRRWI